MITRHSLQKVDGGIDSVHKDALPDRTEFPELLQVPAARQTSHKRLIRAGRNRIDNEKRSQVGRNYRLFP
jgi:hypothetical protein